MKVQLLYFPGCPNVERAREIVGSVLRAFPDARFEELDVTAAQTPPSLRDWGSPTILIDGMDAAGDAATGSCCRLYDDHDPNSRGVPSERLLRRALEAARSGPPS